MGNKGRKGEGIGKRSQREPDCNTLLDLKNKPRVKQPYEERSV